MKSFLIFTNLCYFYFKLLDCCINTSGFDTDIGVHMVCGINFFSQYMCTYCLSTILHVSWAISTFKIEWFSKFSMYVLFTNMCLYR